MAYLAHNRQQIAQELAITTKRRFFSPVFYLQHQAVLQYIQQYLHGVVIDLGCGYAPFSATLPKTVVQYDTLDTVPLPRGPKLTFISDIQNMQEVPSAHYDGALCLEVLEHVPDPLSALREIHRILKPNGTLILTVPHLSRLHDEPHDYYRYTVHGIHYILECAGFEVLKVERKGGLFSFLGHQISTLLLTFTWGIPILQPVMWQLNKFFIILPACYFDKITDVHGYFALGYIASARKPFTMED